MASIACDTLRQIATESDEDALWIAKRALREITGRRELVRLVRDYGLTASEARVYAMLRATPGAVFTVAQLALSIHELGDERCPSIVRHHIKRIRRKVGAGAGIRTIYGLGYYYEGDT